MRRNLTTRPKSTTNNKKRQKSKDMKYFSNNIKSEEDNFEQKIAFNCSAISEIVDIFIFFIMYH